MVVGRTLTLLDHALQYFYGTAWKLALYALVFVALESLWPAVRSQSRWRRDSRIDVLAAFVVPLLSFPLYYGAMQLLAPSIGSLVSWPALAALRAAVGQ